MPIELHPIELHPIAIIDMQKDFTTQKLANSKAKEVIAAIVKLIDSINDDQHPLFLSKDFHTKDFKDTLEGKHFPEHCISGTDGMCIDDDIMEAVSRLRDRVPMALVQFFTKESFGSLQLPELMNDYANEMKVSFNQDYVITSIQVCGLVSSICVISTALILRAAFPNVPIRVDPETTAGLYYDDNQAALKIMDLCLIDVKEK